MGENEMNGNKGQNSSEQDSQQAGGQATSSAAAGECELTDAQLKERDAFLKRRLKDLELDDGRRYHGAIDFGGDWYRAEDGDEARRLKQEQRAIWRIQAHREWLASEAGKLCRAFYDKFQEYRTFLEQNRWARDKGRDFTEHELFKMGLEVMLNSQRERAERDRTNLEMARQMERCTHIHENGEQCGCPRLKGKERCYMHQRLEYAKALQLDLGAMEDPDSMLVALKKLQKATIEESLSDKQIRRLTSLLRIAMWNAPRTTFANRGTEGE